MSLGFTDIIADLDFQYEWGWFVISMVSLFILINMSVVIAIGTHNLFLLMLKKYRIYRRNLKKAKKVAKE